MTRYRILTHAHAIYEAKTSRYTGEQNGKPTFETVSAGWYLRIGNISFFLDTDKPEIKPGDTISIIVEKAD